MLESERASHTLGLYEWLHEEIEQANRERNEER